MNGLDKITARLKADAEADAAALVEKTAQEADAMISEYRIAADSEYLRLEEQALANAESMKEQQLSAARLDAGKQILTLKQELLSEAFSLAENKLRQLPPEQYSCLLVKLAVKASRTGTEELVFNAEDRLQYGADVVKLANAALAEMGKKAELTLSSREYPIGGGLVLKDGAIEVNCSLATLLETRREELSVEAARHLFR